MKTLNIPRADVPIEVCAQCHINTATKNPKTGEGVDATIFSEMKKRTEDSKFVCTGCHTTAIGSVQPKCDHYIVLGQKCKQ
jgi:hypothetical protein